MNIPGFWMNETSGVLRPATETYLRGEPMTTEQIAAMRAYLRQWIEAPTWEGADNLKHRVDDLTNQDAIHEWLSDAIAIGIDPL
jgi:hypothetical protein